MNIFTNQNLKMKQKIMVAQCIAKPVICLAKRGG
jgi:hypothetical protein